MVAAGGAGFNNCHAVTVGEQRKCYTRTDGAGTDDHDITHGGY
jgi:hypothetical protein